MASSRIDSEKIQQGVRLVLEGIGQDPRRAGIAATPERVARMYQEVFGGVDADPDSLLATLPSEQHDEMVLIRDIPFYSICEHHLLPFIGKAHVAYLPEGKICGLSKIARVIDVLSRRPQVQERLTSEIADVFDRVLQPRGVLVIIEAEHLCMTMRGIKKPGSITVTSVVRGIFRENEATRKEALALIYGRSPGGD
jgi:GTP cyclohydrolase I